MGDNIAVMLERHRSSVLSAFLLHYLLVYSVYKRKSLFVSPYWIRQSEWFVTENWNPRVGSFMNFSIHMLLSNSMKVFEIFLSLNVYHSIISVTTKKCMITLHEKEPCDSFETNYSWVIICKHIVGELYNDYFLFFVFYALYPFLHRHLKFKYLWILENNIYQ